MCDSASPAVQWLGFHASTANGMGSISGRGTEILYAMQCDQKNKNKKIKDKVCAKVYSTWHPSAKIIVHVN